MKPMTLEEAKRRGWDVILAGSSFAACFFAHALKGRGLKVLFVERGRFIDHDTQLANRTQDHPALVAQNNRSERRKDWTIRYQFGGCSNCWWGNTPRLHPSDFELRTRYGVGADWPLSYAALEPYMAEAEEIMQIAGGGSDAFLPRSRPYPLPPHAPTRAEKVLMEHDPSWVPMPTARASRAGKRSACCATGACNLCPVDAKFTILNGMADFADPGFAYVTGAEVRTVVTEAGAAKGVTVRTPDGAEMELKADFVGLAANAISNAAILLRSGLGGGLVGQGLHEQAGQFVWFNIPFDNYYGGTSITGAGYGLYDGDFRREAASVFIESWNAPPALRLERDKWLQRLRIKLVAEDLPLSENRVVLEGGEAKVVWVGHSDYAYAGLARARDQISGLLPFEHEVTRFGDFEPTESHIQGGTPMAATPAEGVVDRDCRVFGVKGLACLGSGVFPACAAANPTLTLSAVSLRAGETL
ncbi:MAG: GMC oxidoreductase [Pseudomonadota bacterium]